MAIPDFGGQKEGFVEDSLRGPVVLGVPWGQPCGQPCGQPWVQAGWLGVNCYSERISVVVGAQASKVRGAGTVMVEGPEVTHGDLARRLLA